MKILFTLTPAFNPNDGGVQRTTYKLGKYFTEFGVSVGYYSMTNHGHVEVEYGQFFSAPAEGLDKNPVNCRDLTKVLRQWKPDIVINQMPYEKELRETLYQGKQKLDFILLGCLRNSLFSFKSNAQDIIKRMLPPFFYPLVDNLVGMGLVQAGHWIKHRNALKTIIKQHDRFILLTPPNRQELEYFVGKYKPEKVLAIPNSIPVVNSISKKEKIILHVGRLNIPQKRSDLLLEFWEKVHYKLPDWSFVIVGDGPYLNELKGDLKRRSLPRVRIEGYQKPESYYEQAAIFMMPSAYEGFPNTILEAQRFGCAILAFNSYAALGWIVNDGRDAMLIQPFNTTQMAQQAIEIAMNDQVLHSMQQAGLENAGRFTIDRVGKQWLKLFTEF